MAKSMRVACKGCKKICSSLPVPVEIISVIPSKNFKEIANFEAVWVYCEASKQRVFIYL